MKTALQGIPYHTRGRCYWSAPFEELGWTTSAVTAVGCSGKSGKVCLHARFGGASWLLDRRRRSTPYWKQAGSHYLRSCTTEHSTIMFLFGITELLWKMYSWSGNSNQPVEFLAPRTTKNGTGRRTARRHSRWLRNDWLSSVLVHFNLKWHVILTCDALMVLERWFHMSFRTEAKVQFPFRHELWRVRNRSTLKLSEKSCQLCMA